MRVPPGKGPPVRRFFKSAAFPILIVVMLAFVAQRLISPSSGTEAPLAYNDVRHSRSSQRPGREVTMRTRRTTRSRQAEPARPLLRPAIPTRHRAAKLLNNCGAARRQRRRSRAGRLRLLSLLTYILPFLLFFGFWIFLMNQMQGGGSRVMSFGKSRAKRMSVDAPKITFRDVAGADEAVAGVPRDQGVPREPEEVPGARRPDPEGRPPLRAAGHR